MIPLVIQSKGFPTVPKNTVDKYRYLTARRKALFTPIPGELRINCVNKGENVVHTSPRTFTPIFIEISFGLHPFPTSELRIDRVHKRENVVQDQILNSRRHNNPEREDDKRRLGGGVKLEIL